MVILNINVFLNKNVYSDFVCVVLFEQSTNVVFCSKFLSNILIFVNFICSFSEPHGEGEAEVPEKEVGGARASSPQAVSPAKSDGGPTSPEKEDDLPTPKKTSKRIRKAAPKGTRLVKDPMRDRRSFDPDEVAMSPEQADDLVEWYKDNTLFYVKTHRDFKNRIKKNSLYLEKSKEVRKMINAIL